MNAALGAIKGWFGARRESGLPVRDQVDLGGAGRPVRLLAFDQTLVTVVGALVALGVVMVYSASVALPDNPKFANYSQMYFLQRHVLALAIGFVVALVVVQVPTGFWEKQAPAIFVVALILLVLVLLPFIGKVVNFSRRWIPLGFMNFQPSELAKLAIAMYAANYMVRRMDTREKFFRAVTPMVVAVAFVGVLLMRQPDMGAFIVVATIAMGILFLGGVNARMFFLMAVVILATASLYLYFDDLRRERILAYLDPWNPKYAQGKGYQLTHSLIALGRGEIFGQGLGSSVEKLHYLPEAHTDFLLAVIGEELGFVGVAVVITLFFWMTRRIFLIGRQAIALDRVYAGLFCEGIGVWMGFQAFINMGVNLGVLPTKGLTLPLMSYGGSAILMNLVALAMVLRVDIENRTLMRGAHVMPHLVVMAAGTGGHIIPGLAVAREMQGRGWSVSWLGTSHGMENQLVPQAGIPLDTIRFSGLRGKGLVHTATGGLRLLKAFWDCLGLLRRRSANAVLGMGGYVCFPGGLMASLLNKPLMLVNADAAILLSNKSLLPVADRVAFGFDGDAAQRVRHAVVTGNPVRAEIEALPAPAQRYSSRGGPLRLLVVGGSLGAQVLNETLPAALALMPAATRPQVTHQTGEAQAEAVRAAYAAAGVPASVLAFIDDMAQQLADCDLMVCRAGAITVSELCAAGVPAILVPLIVSTTSHQRDNAQWMASHGAALHLPQADLNPQALAHTLAGLTREDLLAMAKRAHALAKPHAAARVADEIEALLARRA